MNTFYINDVEKVRCNDMALKPSLQPPAGPADRADAHAGKTLVA